MAAVLGGQVGDEVAARLLRAKLRVMQVGASEGEGEKIKELHYRIHPIFLHRYPDHYFSLVSVCLSLFPSLLPPPSHRLVEEENHGRVDKELVVADGLEQRQALVDAVRLLPVMR